MIAIVHSGMGTLIGHIGLFTFPILLRLDGPAKSVTVRDGTLEVRNSIRRYEVPPSRILPIERMGGLGVLVRVEGHEPIRVGAFSRSQMRWRRPSGHELRAKAKSLTDAPFATPTPADRRQPKATYRWGNVFLCAAVAAGLPVLFRVANGPTARP